MNISEVFRSTAGLLGVEIASLLLVWMVARYRWWKADFASAKPALVRDSATLFCTLARNRAGAVLAVAAIAVLGRLCLLPWMPAPVPGVHDEFSYLLAGNTFAMGRLANPTSPFWQHLETFHEIQIPSFASMYPPAQGLFLAAGKLLIGNPWAGVCLSTALLSAAACWMLQGWVPGTWAFFGGLMAASRYAIVGYWVNSYWGGAVTALGAMLVLGSVPRLFRCGGSASRLRDCLAPGFSFGFGTLLLETSRPYEGLVFVAGVFCWCFGRFLFLRPERKRRVRRRTALPAASILVAGNLAMLGYFYAVTGSPLRMPYMVNAGQYLISRPFLWQDLAPEPEYRHPVMRAYYEKGTVERHQRLRTVPGFLAEIGNKFRSTALFYAWPGVLLLAFVVPRARKNPILKLCMLLAGTLFVALCLEEWPMQAHYAAPMASVVLLGSVVCLRTLWRNPRFPVAARQLPAVLYAVLCIGAVVGRAGAAMTGVPVTHYGWVPWGTDRPGNMQRSRLEATLNRIPGKHLVFLHYEQQHDPSEEWVYNEPDVDHARIIWAREISAGSDAELTEYYKDRIVWKVDPDHSPVRVAMVGRPGYPLVSNSSLRKP